MPERKLVLYIAMSLDGYIAQPNDDLSFLALVAKEGEDYGYYDFLAKVDTVVLGRKTYEWVMRQVPEFPHADKETYIWTRTPKPSTGNTHFYAGPLDELVKKLKQRSGGLIFCDGGAEVVNELLKNKLIDELIISVIPVLLGDGTRLFQPGRPMQTLKLLGTQHFETRLVQLHYASL